MARKKGKRRTSSQSRQAKPFWRRVLLARVTTGVLAIAIVFGGLALAKEINRQVAVNEQIDQLALQIDELEQNNAELDELFNYYNSSSFQDKEARRKLALQAEGETVVLVPAQENATSIETSNGTGAVSNTTLQPEAQYRTPLQEWQDYFFNN